MTTFENKKKVLISRPVGSEPLKEEHFETQTETINTDDLQDGYFIVKNLYISIDPTYKGWATSDTYVPASPLNERMNAIALGQVVASKNNGFPEGAYVTGILGAQYYAVLNGESGANVVPDEVIEGLGGAENFIPVLGLTGLPTAFVGIEVTAGDMEKEGKTLVVSGAAGNVGQWVVQLGKLHYKMRVVGIAGSEEKLEYLRELGCDEVINYKTQDIGEALSATCPNGIDLYFDNVGGNITEQVLYRLNKFARVAFCGIISTYVSDAWANAAYGMVLLRSARVQGFVVMDRPDLIEESATVALSLLKNGATYKTYPLEGLDNFVPGLDALWAGANTGKVYLKLQH
eukprot:TRINITY_DN95_c0_g2_i1.p1 TRINITY_DN95_c0_g2~~TRINITY_DN95_c0_g2_i1.p1  ORF type:complete len:362 (+),score=101.70 TRINITY_DN95_c0_g2_i1:54-1088(+)